MLTSSWRRRSGRRAPRSSRSSASLRRARRVRACGTPSGESPISLATSRSASGSAPPIPKRSSITRRAFGSRRSSSAADRLLLELPPPPPRAEWAPRRGSASRAGSPSAPTGVSRLTGTRSAERSSSICVGLHSSCLASSSRSVAAELGGQLALHGADAGSAPGRCAPGCGWSASGAGGHAASPGGSTRWRRSRT